MRMQGATIVALALTVRLLAAAVALAAFTDVTTTSGSSLAADASFPPVLQSAPDVEQTAQVGTALSVTTGDWAPPGTSFAYRWLRCDAVGAGCAAIAGQTAATYTAQAADNGLALRAEVTANRGDKSTVAVSEPTQATRLLGGPTISGANPAAVAANMPQVTGTMTVGSTLSVSNGTWSLALTFARQWLRCSATGGDCVPIAGATGATYVLAAADSGRRLRVQVSATTVTLISNAVLTRDTAVIA